MKRNGDDFKVLRAIACFFLANYNLLNYIYGNWKNLQTYERMRGWMTGLWYFYVSKPISSRFYFGNSTKPFLYWRTNRIDIHVSRFYGLVKLFKIDCKYWIFIIFNIDLLEQLPVPFLLVSHIVRFVFCFFFWNQNFNMTYSFFFIEKLLRNQ